MKGNKLSVFEKIQTSKYNLKFIMAVNFNFYKFI